MEVTVYGPLRGATGGKTVELEFEGGTVREALEALVEAYPRAGQHLFRADGRLEPSARTSVNGESVAPDERCPADADLHVHPPMRGG